VTSPGRWSAALAVGVVVMVATACSGRVEHATRSPGTNPDSWAARAEREASAEQRAMVADGEVTRAEYDAAYQSYLECMRIAGYPVEELPDQGPFHASLRSDAAVRSGADDTCTYRHYQQVDSLWQAAHDAEQPGTLQLAKCAAEHGVTIPPGSRSAAIVAAMERAGLDPTLCTVPPEAGAIFSSTSTPAGPVPGE